MGPFWSAQGTTGPHWTEMAVEFSTETFTEEGGTDGAEKVHSIMASLLANSNLTHLPPESLQ